MMLQEIYGPFPRIHLWGLNRLTVFISTIANPLGMASKHKQIHYRGEIQGNPEWEERDYFTCLFGTGATPAGILCPVLMSTVQSGC